MSSSSSHDVKDLQDARAQALSEAMAVIESEDYQRLEGFNLLGVVANPRSGGFAASMHSPRGSATSMGHANSSSAHGGLEGGIVTTAASSNDSSLHSWFGGGSTTTTATTNNNDAFTLASQMDSAVHHITEQIDALNAVLEQWSRQYLGTYYYTDDEQNLDYLPPQDVSELKELPENFVSLNLQSVQDYLETSGKLAHDFYINKSSLKLQGGGGGTDVDDDDDGDDDELMEEVLQSVPSAFFQTDFDLTDPKTFCELLVLDDDKRDDDSNNGESEQQTKENHNSTNDELHPCLSVKTEDILRLPPPESFSEHLDKVEVALLKQVRSKSSAFFTETNRFSQLKEWIAGLVKDVRSIRNVLQSTRDSSVVAWELIPILDQKRSDLATLLNVLESALEVIRTKSSVGGLLSAGDDLMAAEQVQYARRLLSSSDQQQDGGEVGRLVALHTVGDQLSQYESLVVNNLAEELVELFLSWKAPIMNGSSSTLPRTMQEMQQRVRDVVHALTMCKSLTRTGKAYQNRLNEVIRIAVRTTVEQFADVQQPQKDSVTTHVTSMSLERFVDCLDLLFEQLLALIKSAVGVNNFCREEGFTLKDEETTVDGNAPPPPPPPPPSTPAGTTTPSSSSTSGRATAEAVGSAAELSSKSVSELLRLRKETHSLATLEEMKRLWDACTSFTLELEKASGHKAYGLRSTLLAQAKAFVERKHESNMSALVAALDSERWTQCDVSAERQAALTRLCSGRAVMSSSTKRLESRPDRVAKEKMTDAEVEGIRYKVVWSCLLLVEMVMANVASAACFQALATNVVSKVAELLRLFNSRTTHLVLGAGALQSAARLKSINAKHLSLVTQCLGLIIAILPHIRAALMAQLPTKQHLLLQDLDKIKKEYGEHNEKVLNKFVTIIGGIVEHGLAPRMANTDFDERAKSSPVDNGAPVPCCVFMDGVFTNTKKLHHVLSSLLPGEHLQDVFSRIFAYLDQKVPVLYIAAGSKPKGSAGAFVFPTTDEGKRRMILEMEEMTKNLNGLVGVQPWDFTAMTVLERKMDFELRPNIQSETNGMDEAQQDAVKPAFSAEEPPPVETSKGEAQDEASAQSSATNVQAAPAGDVETEESNYLASPAKEEAVPQTPNVESGDAAGSTTSEAVGNGSAEHPLPDSNGDTFESGKRLVPVAGKAPENGIEQEEAIATDEEKESKEVTTNETESSMAEF